MSRLLSRLCMLVLTSASAVAQYEANAGAQPGGGGLSNPAKPPLAAASTGLLPKSVAVSGVVQAVSPAELAGLDAFCFEPSHTLECSDGTLYLVSATVDLDAYVGQNVKAYGQTIFECPYIDVQSVEVPAPVTLDLCGTGGFGCPVRLRSGPGGLAQHTLFVALAAGFFPLNPAKGSVLLGEPFFQIASKASTGPGAGAAFDFTIPPIPALIGAKLYFQTVRKPLTITTDVSPPGPPVLSNAACLEIVGVTAFCVDPDC